MFGMPKKTIEFITNDNRMLDLTAMGVSPNDVILLNIKKSIYEILEDNQEIDLIKQSSTSGKNVYIIVKENFPQEMGSIENLEDFKKKFKKAKKTFKKSNNLFFFFGNVSSLEQIYGIEDGKITMSDSSFFDQFDEQKKILLEEERAKEEERKKLEEELLNKRISEDESLNLDENGNPIIDANDLDESSQLNSHETNASFSVDQKDLVIKKELVTNDFDKEFDELSKKEKNILDYPTLDSREYLLKSIYDFIWRMLILSNSNLLLNDLLYLSINNFPSLSSGQNEFVRDLSNESDSLFDIILKLDHKLEFNNKLFYIYLANLFTVVNGFCKVNREFLFDISIWVSDEARENFVTRTENYMNNSLVSIEKVIYSHFIEFATLAQGSIPRIRGSLKHQDIHLVLYKKIQNSRNRNLFCIIIRNLFRASHEIGLDFSSTILDSENINNLDSKLKIDIANAYNILLEEVRNFIFLKGINEVNIPKLYNILMNIGIQNIIDERVQITTISELVEKEQVEIEDDYFKHTNAKDDRNGVVNIKYEEIEALYKEAVNSEKQKNINDEIFEFDLDSIQSDFINERRSRFSKEYGIDKELSLNTIDELKNDDEMANKIDSYEFQIKANIKKMEEQRRITRERIAKYSNSNKTDSNAIKLK